MTNDVQIRITADAAGVEAAAKRGSQAIAGMEKSLSGTERATESLTASFSRMGHAAVAGLGVQQIAQTADAWANLNARLSLVTSGSAAAAVAYERVLTIAQATRMGIGEVGQIYEKFARQSDDLKLSSERIAGLTTTVAQAMAVSGASTESAQAALLQFGQALSSGVLRGEELNSILEQSPRLAQALADGLGVPIGRLRELGEAGQLTSEKLVTALEGQATRISAEFARMPVTIGGALTNVRNAWTATVGSFEQSTGVFKGAAGGLQMIADNMNVVAVAGGALASVMAGRVAGAIMATVSGKVAAVKASQQLTAAELAEAVAAQSAAAAQIRAAGAYGAGAVAAKALADAEARLASAQAAAAATGPLATGIRMLGGPIGVVTTALSLGVTAWSIWGNSAAAAANQAKEALRDAEEEAARLGKETLEVARSRLDMAAQRYEESGKKAGSPERADWSKWDHVVKELETKERNLAERSARMASTVSEKWTELYATQAVKRSQAVAKLDAAYAKEVAAAAGSQERILKLTRDYQEKLGVIKKEFSDKEASKEQAQVIEQQFENRIAAITHGVAREEELLKAARDADEIDEREYWDRIATLRNGGLAARAEVLKQQLKGTTDASKREKIYGYIQDLGSEAEKAATAYMAAMKKIAKTDKEFWESILGDHAQAASEEAKALEEKAKSAEQENEAIGKTADQLQELIARRYDEQIQLKRDRLDALKSIEVREDDADAIQRQVEAIDRQISALERLKSADMARPGLQQQAQAWQEFSRDIEQSLTDALMRSFEAGDSFGKAFAKNLENTFKTMVLKFVVQAIVAGGGQLMGISTSAGSANAISNMSGFASNWNGAGAFGGAISNYAGQGLIGISNATGWKSVGDYGANLISGANVLPLGGMLTAYQQGGVGGFVSGAASTALAGGVSGMVSGAGFMSGASSALGGLGPWGWAALAAMAILGGLDKGGGPKQEGGAVRGIDAAGNISAFSTGDYYSDGRNNNLSYGSNGAMSNMVGATLTGIDQYVHDLGGSIAGMQLGLKYNTDPQGSAPDMVASDVYDASGNLYFHHDNNSVNRGDYQKEIANEIKRATIAAVDLADINPIFESIVHGIDEATASAEQLDAAIAQLSVADKAIDIAKLLGLDTESYTALLSKTKDIAGLGQDMANYYSGFYSQEEQFNAGMAAMGEQFTLLGLSMPLTKDGFKDLVDGLDLTTESGRSTYAMLLKMAPSFLSVADAAQQAAAKWAGFDAAGMGQMLLDAAFNPQKGMTAAESFAKALEQSVRTALISSTVGSIAQNIYNSIVVPMAAGAAVSAAAIDGVVAKAQAALNAMGAVLQNLDLTQITNAAAAILPKLTQYAPVAAATQAQYSYSTADAQKSAAESAAAAIKQEWQSVADAIIGTMRDLRGEILNESQNYAAEQARFAIATAAARAGDKTAAQQLPDLARSVVDLGKAVTATAAEQAYLAATTLASLRTTVDTIGQRYGIEIPAFAVGTNYVPYDMDARIHKGERIIPAADNRALMDAVSGSSGLAEEVRALREEVRQLRENNSAENKAIVKQTFDTAQILRRVAPDEAITTRAAV